MADVRVGSYAVVEEAVTIGAGCEIGVGVVCSLTARWKAIDTDSDLA